MPDLKKFCQLAKKLGAKEAKIISTKDVFTSPWVRIKCQYGCDLYGKCLTCPPYSPTPEQTRKILDSCKKALLVHCDDSSDVREIVVELERAIFLDGYYKSFAFSCGPCRLCSKCRLKECRHSEKARPSMESAGIDVFATARKAGFPIKVLTSYNYKPNYYGLVVIG